MVTKADLPKKGTITQEQRVALYVRIIQENLLPKGPLTEFTVNLIRAKAPSQAELDACNAALKQCGWEK